MNDQDLAHLLERNREEVPVGHPPADLLAVARAERRRRRVKATGIAAATVVVLAGLGYGVHAATAGTTHRTPAASSPPTPAHPGLGAPEKAAADGPALGRRVGINGWVVTVPGSWGTDRVACDRVTALRPTIVFDHHLPVRPHCSAGSDPARVPSIRITSDSVSAAPWRTISGVAARRSLPKSRCPTCAAITVPSRGATFEIHARTAHQLHVIEHSLQPLSDRIITVPVWQVPASGPQPLDQMSRLALASGLRPQTLERPSGAAPGHFLETIPALGTPIDLGRGITIVYSAGDLARYATTASLHDQGWKVFSAHDFSPPVSREQARQIASPPNGRSRSQIFLRNLVQVHGEPAAGRIKATLAWLVVDPAGRRGGRTINTIKAVDAGTGRVIGTDSGFVGRPSE